MKKMIFILLFLNGFVCFSQEMYDHKIIVTVEDSTGLYQKAKESLTNRDYFIVRENPSHDTLMIFTRHYFVNMGYVIALATVSGNRVIFWGGHGFRQVREKVYGRIPEYYEVISYYKESKSWFMLGEMAKTIRPGTISYEK